MSDQEFELYTHIGRLLIREREKKGFTAVDVSNKLNKNGVTLSDTSIRRYESGKHRINMETLKELCDLYGVNYIDIIKEAKVDSIKETDSSCRVYCNADPDPIVKSHGEESAKLLYYFSKLNAEGKDLVLKQAEALSQLGQYTEVVKNEKIG